MNEIEHAIACARVEYTHNGLLATTTVMKLTNLGLDVPTLEEEFASENH
jgi:hypothetical protein